MIHLNFLEATDGKSLSKSYYYDTDHHLAKSPYPFVYEVSSYQDSVNSIEDFFNALKTHADQGHCLLKGKLDRPLISETRAGHTRSEEPTQYLVIDYDGPGTLGPEDILRICGLSDVDYILAYSSSAGIESEKFGFHIFMLLDKETRPSLLKKWLKYLNLTSPELSSLIKLNNVKVSLKWPLDISVCQNDKLIYVASPVLGAGVQCSLTEERFQLVKKSNRVTSISHDHDESILTDLTNKMINALRAQEGLPPRQYKVRKAHGTEVMCAPDATVVTGIKEERGFVYLNLNGGDSWGYYHPITKPHVLYNFKGEPNYLIRELLPDYYPEAVNRAKENRQDNKDQEKCEYLVNHRKYLLEKAEAKETAFHVFRDEESDKYYIGRIDFEEMRHVFHNTSSKEKAAEYMIQQGLPYPKIIPTWRYDFMPENSRVIDLEQSQLNKFQPSQHLLNAKKADGLVIPPHIKRLVFHVCGSDKKAFDYFINWLAAIYQYRTRTQTAWIFQGTTGTGKGVLFNHVIAPLIGRNYCHEITLPLLEEQFNKYAEQCLVLFVDEVDTDQSSNMAKLTAKVRNMVTDPFLALRAMYSDARPINSYINIIMASNKPNSMRIDSDDRRFNVAPYQPDKLFNESDNKKDFLSNIEDELTLFSDYLFSFVIDEKKLTDPLENAAKRQLQSVTQTAIEEVLHALQTGDLGYFVESIPNDPDSFKTQRAFGGNEINLVSDYTVFIRTAIKSCRNKTPQILIHEDLFIILELLVGNLPSTKAKLKKRLEHEGLEIKPHTQGGTSHRGYKVTWRATQADLDQWERKLITPLRAA